ncbi:hypothetical protein [Clostridium algidicarnis]|uniref:Uncharacterized protein n=2 Tax=Clostridium algidicarnis TaxID=37659 RepID=A0A2S6FUV3_9CLOT|nr:hypothetical protein [Clostridium algidicarnis]MBB6632238.1 hypothetical protein [Clostridium algidicarnis]MBB6698464.1 hypothetical protein [Clostridium algidicarnis]MBU3194676.1 hypothetical protein [Clostridium algidicarnis]MBU3197352.1 hypothetical protein [Clostridium algidicarnis]MBU3205086.1 hypothetical protein [Clostridium algidicarnis]
MCNNEEKTNTTPINKDKESKEVKSSPNSKVFVGANDEVVPNCEGEPCNFEVKEKDEK